MSSSFLRLASLAFAAASATAGAADAYFTPLVDGGVEYHTNLDLTPDGQTSAFKQDVAGYVMNAGGIAGVRTPRGFTELRPRLQFQEFPDRDDKQKVNGFLDLRSRYANLKSSWEVNGRFRHQDRTEAEIVDAGYDDFDPANPAVDSAGRATLVKETLTDWQLRPVYQRSLSERLGFGVSGLYQAATFDTDSTVVTGSDYSSWEAAAFLTWQARERTRLQGGTYVAQYETDDGFNLTKGYGLTLDIRHEWSQTLTGTFSVDAERTDVDLVGSPTDSSNNYGATVSVVRRGEVSQWQFDAGRTFTPSTYGWRSNVDQVRLQLRRNLSQRLRLTTALRGFRQRAQGSDADRDDDRDYLRGELDLRWEASRNWFVSGGYSYTWQEYTGDPGSGDDNMFVVRIGYAGLAPQR